MSYKIIDTDYDYHDNFCGFSITGDEKFETIKIEYITIEVEDEADIENVLYDYSDYELQEISGCTIKLSRVV